jgi:hypothetical protein
MTRHPIVIKLDDIPEIIAREFRDQDTVTIYVGSNAATPTASLDVITAALKAGRPRLPFLRMVHLLLQGPVSYVEKGLQDRVMVYSMFSTGDVRQAANEGRAFYLPCTLANLDSLIGKGRRFEPDVAIVKVSRNPFTGEFCLGLSVEALHTAIDHARVASPLPLLDEFLAAAEQCGFTLTESVDLTSRAAPTIDYFIQRIPRYRSRIIGDLGGPEAAQVILAERGYIDVCPGVGDLLIFDGGRNYHLVTEVRRGTRWTLGGFIALTKEHERVLYWS